MASTFSIEAMVRGYHVYKDMLSTMPCRGEPFNSSVRPARKPAVFAASFQPLEAADIKASVQRGKRAKRLYFHTVSKTFVAPMGSYSAILGCLVETLLIASFVSRIADELNLLSFGESATGQVERHSLPHVSHVSVCMRITKTFRGFLFLLVDSHPP